MVLAASGWIFRIGCWMKKGFGKRAGSFGGGPIRHIFAAVPTDADVALFGMAHKSLKQAQTRTVFANHGSGFIGEDLLVGVGFQELANPEATGITPGPSGRQGVVGPNHLVAVGDMGSRTQEQRSITSHVFQEPIVAVGHHLHMLGIGPTIMSTGSIVAVPKAMAPIACL
jgi:hypothetical protein